MYLEQKLYIDLNVAGGSKIPPTSHKHTLGFVIIISEEGSTCTVMKAKILHGGEGGGGVA